MHCWRSFYERLFSNLNAFKIFAKEVGGLLRCRALFCCMLASVCHIVCFIFFVSSRKRFLLWGRCLRNIFVFNFQV